VGREPGGPRPLGRDTVAGVLADVARLGPFFAVTVPDPGQDLSGWRPLRELTPLALIDDHARRLGVIERRVAASLLFQGLAARLWSPVVAAAALHAVVPDLSEVRLSPGGPMELCLAEPAGRSADDLTEPVLRTVVDGHLRPLVAKIREVVPISEGLLWGNAASALAGCLYVRSERPESAGPLGGLVRRLLAREPLLGTGSLAPDGSFVRRSCCLYYRVPPGGAKCGDCVLLHPPREMSGI
jgi:ferric iron reductase protein FhuF